MDGQGATQGSVKSGSDELLKQLQKQKSVGTIRTPDSIGYDLRYAHEERTEEGGRRVVIATDRPIGFWEATNRPRTMDYPFTVIQMELDKHGEGKGTMSYATKIQARGKRAATGSAMAAVTATPASHDQC